MLVDSHCHLQFLDLTAVDNDLDKIVKQAEDEGVACILSVATELDQHDKLLAYCERYPNVYMSVGVHPNDSIDAIPSIENLVKLAGASKKVIAFGETGLDYYRETSDKKSQELSFMNHIEAAKALKKPLIIHTRNAKADTIAVMRAYEASLASGVLHCFTEDYEMAKKALDLNCYISFSGIVTFKNAVDLQEVAKKIPLERILVETDAPYLAPIPYRGKQNLPAYVKNVAQFLAQLREESFEKICEQTTKNFYSLFGFS
jgi:TatD DNase family protein